MAQNHQASATRATTLLDLQGKLAIEDGLILKGTRIVILSKQHQAILKQIHGGHLWLNKCKLRAKETVYWPGLNIELEDLVLNCELCLKYSTAKCKQEPSLALGQEVPLCPWTKLATDIFLFWRGIISTHCRLHKPLPSSVQAYIHDRPAHSRPIQTDMFRIWMAWNFSVRQWPMLYFRDLHQPYDWIQCQSHHKLAPLPTI